MDKLEQLMAGKPAEAGITIDAMSLMQNVPNPFTVSTTIQYSIVRGGAVQLDLYNSEGALIRTLENVRKDAGSYQVELDGSALKPGSYIYILKLDGAQVTRKAIKL